MYRTRPVDLVTLYQSVTHHFERDQRGSGVKNLIFPPSQGMLPRLFGTVIIGRIRPKVP